LLRSIIREFVLLVSCSLISPSQMDSDGSGSIDYKEFVQGAAQLLLLYAAQEQASLSSSEEDAYASAEAAEYLAHGMTSQELEDIVQASWNAADADGSGFLDQKELKHFLRDLPIGLTKKEMNMIMMEVDANEDGLVSYESFMPLMHNCLYEVTKQLILRSFHSQSDLERLLQTSCEQQDKDGSGRLKIKKAASALKHADIGLSKFQILSICGNCPSSDKNSVLISDFVPFASKTIEAVMGSDAANASAAAKMRGELLQRLGEEEVVINGKTLRDIQESLLSFFQQADPTGSGVLEHSQVILPAQFVVFWLTPASQFEILVCEQLETSGLDVSHQLQQLLLTVAEEQADGNVIYSDTIVDAGSSPLALLPLLSRCMPLHYVLTLFALLSVRQLEYMDTEARLRDMGA
jgi:Ca2+-binding EF-hand superfamily protein